MSCVLILDETLISFNLPLFQQSHLWQTHLWQTQLEKRIVLLMSFHSQSIVDIMIMMKKCFWQTQSLLLFHLLILFVSFQFSNLLLSIERKGDETGQLSMNSHKWTWLTFQKWWHENEWEQKIKLFSDERKVTGILVYDLKKEVVSQNQIKWIESANLA